jgi:hypothetical protein
MMHCCPIHRISRKNTLLLQLDHQFISCSRNYSISRTGSLNTPRRGVGLWNDAAVILGVGTEVLIALGELAAAGAVGGIIRGGPGRTSVTSTAGNATTKPMKRHSG